MEHELVSQVLSARGDARAADDLVRQYLPFIKAETAKFPHQDPGHGEDALSIAMFAFHEAVLAYQPGRGGFLTLAARAIRNRLIDFHRKERRHKGLVSLDTPVGEENDATLLELVDTGHDEITHRQDRSGAQAEISHFSRQLSQFGLALTDIAENCPKQSRTLDACLRCLAYAKAHPELLDQLVSTRKLPLTALAVGSGVERKTLERHRKYLVAILLAYTNGFEIIRGHLSQLAPRKGGGA